MAEVSVLPDRSSAFTINASSIFSTKTSILNGEKDNNNNEPAISENTSAGRAGQAVQAVLFKYRRNVAKKYIDELRRLIASDRANQSVEEQEFYKFDYERLMLDDWLMSRFILRGMKVAPTGTASTTNPTSQHLYEMTIDTREEQDKHHNRQQIKLAEQAMYARTIELIRSCARFRYEYGISSETKLGQFPLDWTDTHGLFKYEPDLRGNPTVYLRVALHRPKLIDSSELRFLFKRYMLYTLEQADQDLFNDPGKAICCVFDLTNVALENIDLELTSWMVRSFKSSGPKLVCYVIVYNPPWFFTTTFKLISSTLLSGNKKQCVKFVYGEKILDFIAFDKLPPYLKVSLA